MPCLTPFFARALLGALALAGLSAPQARASSWALRGRIIPTASAPEKGHYEVGFFGSRGPDGLPLGYPLSQEILPAGRLSFELRIPARLRTGYLFAEFVAAGTGARSWVIATANPWSPASPQPAQLFLRLPPSSGPTSTGAAPLAGKVTALFSPPGSPLPLAGAVVKVRGRPESAVTDGAGAFSLALPGRRGDVPLEVRKPGFLASVEWVGEAAPGALSLGLVSQAGVEQVARDLGLAHESGAGALLGVARKENGAPLPGLRARLTLRAEGPFYFDDSGRPVRGARGTTSDGRFLFLNVRAGTGFLETETDGEALAPLPVSVSEGGELVRRTVVPVAGALGGRLLDPVSAGAPKPIAGARVRIEGSPEWTSSDSLGFFRFAPLKWSKGGRVLLVTSASGFQNHRYLVRPGAPGPLRLYAFPEPYLRRISDSAEADIEPGSGSVVGRALGPPVRVDAFADHSAENLTRDFYFDARGRMLGPPAMTDPRFGTYMLFGVPGGHGQLLGSDVAGRLRFGRELFAGPGVVNVEVEVE